MKNQNPLDIKWVELLLISLLVLGGMGVWILVERRVAASMQGLAPSEAQSEQDAGVPARKAEVSLVQEEVDQVQAALVKERMAAAEQTAQMQLLAAQFPQIPSIVSSAPGGPPLSLETTQSFLQAQTALAAASGMVKGMEARMHTLVAASVTLTTTMRGLTAGALDFRSAQVELEMTQQELGKVQAELVTQDMEVTRQQAAVQALLDSYPQLAAFSAGGNPGQAIAMPLAQALSAYLEADAQQRRSNGMIAALEAQLARARQQLDERGIALYQAQNRARQDFGQNQETFRMATRQAALLQAGLWALLGILAVGLFLQLTKKFHIYPVRPLGIILAAAALTAVLFSYQAFEFLGGAIAGFVLLVAALLGISAYIRRMEKQAAGSLATGELPQTPVPAAAGGTQPDPASAAAVQKGAQGQG